MPNPSELQQLRQEFCEKRERLLTIHPEAANGRKWIDEYALLVDETLQRIYYMAWDAARSDHYFEGGGPDESSLALLAIGGYGRGDLCPHSDIDIAFVPDEEENPLIDSVIKEAFRIIVEVFIDGAKLDVGYAYRPISDIEHLDSTGKSALVEARLLAGPESLLHRVRRELRSSWDAVAFLLDIARERRKVASLIPLSLYAIEPNIKDGSGALRDIHTIIWVTGAMLRANKPLHELEWRGLVIAHDIEQLNAAREFFLQIRTWLHLKTQKKTDILLVDYQDDCSHALGFTGAGPLASQRLLREYYRHAENVARVLERVLRQLLTGPLPLDGHFVATNRRLQQAHPHAITNHPELILSPFSLAHKYGFTFDPDLDRSIENSLHLVDESTRCHPIIRASFLSLLQKPDDAAEALTHLRARGVLSCVMPEFEDMLHLAPPDPSHQLTVGEHSLQAIRVLGEMWRERHSREELFNLWNGIDDMPVLLLGTLLHDAGKIEPGTDHSVSGEKIALHIAARLGLSSERCDRIGLLVRQHLLLPRTARLRDLASPGTIRYVLDFVPDVEALKMLYLLSVADTRAVGERTYSRLDLEALRELYEKALLAMTREDTAQMLTDAEKREQLAQRERESLRRQVRRMDVDVAESTLRRLDDLPASYVLNNPMSAIAADLQLLDKLPEEGLLVDFQDQESGLFTDMAIVTCDDQTPGLLSKICGVMHSAGVEILKARVHTLHAPPKIADSMIEMNEENDALQSSATSDNTSWKIVLDHLHLAVNGRPLSEAKQARVAAALRSVLRDGKNVEELIREAGKETHSPLFPQRISAHNDLSDEHTVVSVVCDNVPGLMYFLARAIAAAGLDIHSAKITTWSGRAEDAFYVTRRIDEEGETSKGYRDGSYKISDGAISEVLAQLREILNKPEKY